MAADARPAMIFAFSPGQAGDAPQGRALLRQFGALNHFLPLLMDKACGGNETRQVALELGFIPVVPPLSTCSKPWDYDRERYKRRNEVEHRFHRLKCFRQVFSRFGKFDVMFCGFIGFALSVEGCDCVSRP